MDRAGTGRAATLARPLRTHLATEFSRDRTHDLLKQRLLCSTKCPSRE